MRLLDLLRFAGGALRGHRLRTGLSLLGVTIGVAAVVILTSLGEGARRYVTGQFASLGSNLLIVIPGKTETTGALPGVGKPPNDLTLDDSATLQRSLQGARRVVPVCVGTETVAHRERRRQVVVIGATAEMQEVRKLRVRRGRFLPVMEARRAMPVAVLGPKTAHELFGEQDPVGRVVRLADWRMRVVGVLAPRGVSIGVDLNDVVLIPVATAMRMFDRTSLFRILIEVGAYADMQGVEERAKKLLRERHRDEEDFTLITQESVVSSLSGILAALTAALAGIAAISLTVAGIGIMNVMLVSVSERTPEVGLLRALGATRAQVVVLFLSEAALLSSLGGAIGLAAGIGLSQSLRLVVPDFPVTPPGWALGAAIGVSIGTGVVFGVLPAARAARLDPVQALQGKGG